jgi:hypothetical protein
MDEIVWIVLQFVTELIANVVVDLPLEWLARNRNTPEPSRMVLVCVVWLLVGTGVAGISLLIFPNTLIASPSLRLLNAILSPVTSALVSYLLARRSARTNGYVIPGNHFWQALAFTVGFVCVRFVHAGHA